MATQTSPIAFTGRLGNLIGYRRNNKYCLRTMPETVRQTRATRRAAQRFGMASRRGALIRHALYGELDVHCDSTHINRLTSRLIPSAGSNINAIRGFRFNKDVGIDRFFTIMPTLSEDGILHIPPQTLSLPKGSRQLEVKVIATRINFTANRVMDIVADVILLATTADFPGAIMPLQIPGTGTLVVALQVRVSDGQYVSGNRQLLAADIIAVQERKREIPVKKAVDNIQRSPQPQNCILLTRIYPYAQPAVIVRE